MIFLTVYNLNCLGHIVRPDISPILKGVKRGYEVGAYWVCSLALSEDFMFFKPNCCPPLSRNNSWTQSIILTTFTYKLLIAPPWLQFDAKGKKNAMRAHHLIQLVTKNDAWKLLLNILDITVGLTIITPPTASKAKISKETRSSFYRLTR